MEVPNSFNTLTDLAEEQREGGESFRDKSIEKAQMSVTRMFGEKMEVEGTNRNVMGRGVDTVSR